MNESNFARLLSVSRVETAGADERPVGPASGYIPAPVLEPVVAPVPGTASATGQVDASGDVPAATAEWSVPPLARMTALNENVVPLAGGLPAGLLSLSRFAYLRPLQGMLVLESPLSQFRVALTDPRAGNLLLQLADPEPMTSGGSDDPPPEQIDAFMQLLWSGGFLVADPEPPALRMWDFHNLMFHGRKRWHDSAAAQDDGSKDDVRTCPVVKSPMSAVGQTLPVPNLRGASESERSLTAVMEERRSIRSFDDHHPITLDQLSELLFRTARVKGLRTFGEKFEHLENVGSGDPREILSDRPYPGSGARYELELYAAVRHCEGLDGGLYHYDPLHHRLYRIGDGRDTDVAALIEDAFGATARESRPQIVLLVAARFGRMFEAYPYLGYSLILKNVGALFQNLYLVATDMKLAPCAVGEGDVERFGRAAGLDFLEETVVGCFVVGTPGEEGNDVTLAAQPGAIVQAGAAEQTIAVTGRDTVAASTAPVPDSAQAAVEPAAFHPPVHDLDDRLPGLSALRENTLGDPRVTVVVLDGDPDLSLSCFEAADVAKKYPFWHRRAEPISAQQHTLYRQIYESDLEPEAFEQALVASFEPPILNRIIGDRHATHVTSTIAGQPDSPVPGIAPACRVIVVPLNEMGDPGEFMSPLNIARGFELAQELGANVIHCAACVPTQTDQPMELLARAVKQCLDNNILIVAPVGNDGGDCRCIPAVLPGMLAVGALKDDGRPFDFSNWGGNYANDGIMAPGENILCAQPKTEQPIREKGTSLAAPVISGVAALLMSRQLQRGGPIDAEAIRAALLSTAKPCDPALVEEPERCLRGGIDLPAAMDALFPPFEGMDTSSNPERIFQTSAAASPAAEPRNVLVDMAPGMGRTDAVASIVPAAIQQSDASDPGGAVALVSPSTAHSGLVYAIGQVSYDLATEHGVESLQQRMAQAVKDGKLIGANPYDVHDLIEYLDQNPTERSCIIWTLEIDGQPVYALRPEGAYANQIYEQLLHLLNGQTISKEIAGFVERVSIPGIRVDQTLRLLSREELPVVALTELRTMYGWETLKLARDALAAALPGVDVDSDRYQTIQEGVINFLERVYFELHNYGLTSRDRAMNFAATNCAQAASVFAKALVDGRRLDTITVEKSPVCRMNSDCWELYLTFTDPDNGSRATRVFNFTIDVSELIPVTVGAPKSWIKRAHLATRF